jgi:hypothetical protein
MLKYTSLNSRLVWMLGLAVMLLPKLASPQNTKTSVTVSGSAAHELDAGGTDTTTTTSQSQLPSGVEVEVGIASRVSGPENDYQVSNGVIALKNIGRATPQLLTGIGFTPCEIAGGNTTQALVNSKTVKVTTQTGGDDSGLCHNAFLSRLGAFVSVQFGSGSTQTISGYSVGATFGVGSHLRLLAGFSLTPVNQIAPGFANAAYQYVTSNSKLFPGVNPATLTSTSNNAAFDGLQTTSTMPMAGAAPTPAIYYPGSITETHYRSGFLIGVALPINIFSLFSGNSTGKQQQPQ